ncbi:MAG: hypothetical protein IK078_08000, partial [Lachnospiraceae bacterium]|nr:hypothetical protein [Lachnospiraceae bacterium]
MKESENNNVLDQAGELQIPTPEENAIAYAEYESLLENARSDVKPLLNEWKALLLPCMTENQTFLSTDPVVTGDIDENVPDSQYNKIYSIKGLDMIDYD